MAEQYVSWTLDDERRWRDGLLAGRFGVWDLDPAQEAVSFSPGWKQALGFVPEDRPDRTSFWRCRVHPDDLAPMLAALQSTLSGDSLVYEARFRLRSNGGGYRTILSRGKVVERDRHGSALRMVGTMQDVTGRPSGTGTALADTDAASVVERAVPVPLHRCILGPKPDDVHGAMGRERLLAAVADLLTLAAGPPPADVARRGGTSLHFPA